MKQNYLFCYLLLLLTAVISCTSEQPAAKSSEAKIAKLEFETAGTVYATTITGNNISLEKAIPYSAKEVSVKTITVSNGATVNIKAGDKLTTAQTDILVTAEDGVTKQTYKINWQIAAASTEAALTEIVFAYKGADYTGTVSNANIVLKKELPYNADGTISIKSFKASANATANINVGQEVGVDKSLTVSITAEDGKVKNNYTLNSFRDEEGKLLIAQSTIKSCEAFKTFQTGEFMVENNLWNVTGLTAGSYSLCVYNYNADSRFLLGWSWDFPTSATNINAYPEVIYGQKPWYPNTTTAQLPKKIGELGKLKVNYDIEMHIERGSYNLAFDNWISSAKVATPGNVQFEFMIWEDYQNLEPFGTFKETVNTTNGSYKFYMGEPTWEPAGSNWTYVAFARTDKRQAGKVDVDELIAYLVSKGIVSKDSYLSSIEFGNELGNTKGYSVLKTFVVETR
ncbi:GH12 family glycosyl hydrolase domain-containing protein [Emticicia sp. TH156]|uniref:GH12 family glycosyl hydrolase domain-containing protein n=1 Tax=Emticicia sp. TH156 TaxID=2067454 RepID=UPI000C7708E3|nr:hypothetical protein [Emticicia sp. TH156]PLK46034.1 hypothetical protein C0V77_01400 [Emticicia sp. TH156]